MNQSLASIKIPLNLNAYTEAVWTINKLKFEELIIVIDDLLIIKKRLILSSFSTININSSHICAELIFYLYIYINRNILSSLKQKCSFNQIKIKYFLLFLIDIIKYF